MEVDIAPSLLKAVQTDFQSKFDKSSVISSLYAKIRDGTATYVEANEFAVETGNILAQAFHNNLSADALPDGKMYYNIAQRILEPTMTNNYDLISDVCNQVQTALNKSAGIGIKAITPELNTDKITGIINRVSDAENFDDIAWILDEPIKTFSQSIVDDSIKANAEFHSRAGLQPVITRKIAGNCCDWCKAVAGTYRYPDEVPHDVYRRHQRCRCTVDYNPRDGKIQNVHSKKWRNEGEEEKIRARKTVGLKDAKKEKEKRIEKTKEISEKDLNRMSLEELRKLAEETAVEYYESGLSGISFGDADVKKVAETLGRSGSRISLKKDILSMRKKLRNRVEKSAKSGTIKLSNEEVRKQYVYNVSKIKENIDSSLPIEEQAKQAFEARNRIRTEARELMADEATRKVLDETKPNKTFEELVESKMKRKNMTREEAIRDVYNTATKTNEDINRELGIGGE